jgi:hypothetical protein
LAGGALLLWPVKVEEGQRAARAADQAAIPAA